MIEHLVIADEDGFRADKIVANILEDVSYSFLQKLFRLKKVKVNGKRARASDHLKKGDEVKVFLPKANPNINEEGEKGQEKWGQQQLNSKKNPEQEQQKNEKRKRKLAEQFQRMIIFENEDFLAINKPTNLAVQMGSKLNISVETMMREYREDLRLVHRIDKDTSGILLIAKGRLPAQKLTKMFRENKIHKTYLAVVDGKIKNEGIIDNYLHKVVVGNEEKMAVCDAGYTRNLKRNSEKFHENIDDLLSKYSDTPQHAVTKYIPHKISDSVFKYYTLLELHPQTGRKHQLRVHCADVLHAPILGDKKYDRNFSKNCSKNPAVYRHLMLHAYKVQLEIGEGDSRVSNDKQFNSVIEITAELPGYFPKDDTDTEN